MRERIGRHRAERTDWRTIEEPLSLAETLEAHTAPGRVLLVDCLTLWLSNLMLGGHDPQPGIASLRRAIARAAGPLILVSNEVGSGIVPATALGRAFRDEQGRLNQRAAGACDAVVLVTAGYPTLIKPAPPPGLRLE
jgi:adenosylcobinamide kinase/adenosylcobinamide-phosphate guanylyltransferase